MSTIKLRIKRLGDKTLVRALIEHPMDTGRKVDPVTGQVIPAHYIEAVKLTRNDTVVADCQLSTAISRNPYVSFRLRDVRAGDRIGLSWADNLGASDHAEITVD